MVKYEVVIGVVPKIKPNADKKLIKITCEIPNDQPDLRKCKFSQAVKVLEFFVPQNYFMCYYEVKDVK